MEFIQQNILLVALVVVSGGMLIWQSLQIGGRQISPSDATLMINRSNPVVIDVRSAAEFSSGHIQGAINIPRENIKDRLSEIEKWKGRSLIVLCASGVRSSRACAEFRKQGFSEVFELRGGVNAWIQAGLPVKKGS